MKDVTPGFLPGPAISLGALAASGHLSDILEALNQRATPHHLLLVGCLDRLGARMHEDALVSILQEIDEVDSSSHNQLVSLLRYELLLVITCIFGCLIFAAPLFFTEHSLIWRPDGSAQYLNGLIFVGQQTRRLIRSVLAGNGLAFDTFLFNVGFGVDASLLCHFFDPLTWTAVFVPTRYMALLYHFLQFVRVGLSAVTFSFYCLYLKREKSACFVASLCYALGGFAVFWGLMRHPHFINTSYVLPLVALGVERYFREKKPAVFVLSLAYAFALSAYFGYMIFLFVVGYCLIRYFFTFYNRSMSTFLKLVAAFILMGLTAFALSAPASLRYIADVASQNRTKMDIAVPTLYHVQKYLRVMLDSLAGYTWNYVGAVPVICAVALFLFGTRFKKDERRAWCIALLAVLAFSLIPYFGHVFNGFSYVSDRWLFIYDFVFANVVCLALPVVWDLSMEEKKRLTRGLAPLALWVMLPFLVLHQYALIVFLALATLVLAWLHFVAFPTTVERRHQLTTVVVLMVCSGLVTVTACLPKPYGSGASGFATFDYVLDFFTTDNPFDVMGVLPEEERENWRYSFVSQPSPISDYANESLNLNRNSLMCYDSFYNQAVSDYRDELGISDSSFSSYYFGSNSRLALDAFAGAKYFMAEEGQEWRVPATYEDTGLSDDIPQVDTGFSGDYLRVYVTEHALPLGFVCEEAIKRSDYEPLSMAQKQEALLQGCILADEAVESLGFESLQKGDIELNSKDLPFTVSCDEGISLEGKQIVVSKPKAAITLHFDGLPASETYLCFTNLQNVYIPDEASRGSDIKTLLASLSSGGLTDFVITAKSSLGATSVKAFTRFHSQYCGKTDWVFNCGYAEKSLDEIHLSFSKKGTYSFDDMAVVCQPITPIVSELDELREHPLTDIKRGDGKITAHATTDKDHTVALFTQAYSSGWSAKVDGEPAEVLKGDTGFIAVPIDGAGEHDIELTYRTPGLLPGFAVSLLTASCCGVWAAYNHSKKRRVL